MKAGQDAGKYRERAAAASIRGIEDEEEDYAADAAVADEELEEEQDATPQGPEEVRGLGLEQTVNEAAKVAKRAERANGR